MRKTLKQTKSTLINGVLLMGLIGVMIVYLVVIGSDIPMHVYTPDQYAYLSYNRSRVISQDPPVWNLVLPDEQGGQTIPATLSEWETHVRATLDARYEEQEDIVVTVYDLDFRADYHLVYPGPVVTTAVELFFPFPSNLETLHEVRFLVDGEEPSEAQYSLNGISWKTEVEAGEEHEIAIGYQADGVNSFTYALNQGRRSDALNVNIIVSGLSGSTVAENSLPVTGSTSGEESETFTWNYTNLIPSHDVRIDLPTRLGFAQRVEQLQDDFRALAGLAPFLVGLFLVSLAGLLHLGGIHLSLATYLLAGLGLTLFYPLLTFLSGLVNVVLAATVTLLLISSLLLLFLGLTAGWRQTWWRAGLLLTIFLGIFSLGTLTPWWRLLLTSGGLLLVGAFMLQYARRPVAPEPAPESAIESLLATGPEEEPGDEPVLAVTPPPAETIREPTQRHCPHCGRQLADDHSFCPGCGHDTSPFRRCVNCEHDQFVPTELEPAHCVHCGQPLKTP
jgi:hypothetical protein